MGQNTFHKLSHNSVRQLSAALNLRNQATGLEISGGVLKLTNETVDDSATVRVITFVTLLYMPPTFIAVSFTPFRFGQHKSKPLTIGCLYVDSSWHKSIHILLTRIE